MEIIDLSGCKLSNRNGMYGGQAGRKDGIIYNDEFYLIKYPKSTNGMDTTGISYTTAPLSEYIGSGIYKILGFDVHDTFLGFRNGKIVVACRDFCEHRGDLLEIRTIKNYANEYLAEILDRSFDSTGSAHSVDLEETLLHMEHNEILSSVKGISDRFWDCVVIDIFINNNDRNNGNWGLLQKEDDSDFHYELAPVFDNGASFSSKMSDEKIAGYLKDEKRMEASCLNGITAYAIKEKQLTARQMLGLENKELKTAVIRNVPLIKNKMPEIHSLIDNIPEWYQSFLVCSKERKKFYNTGLDMRLDKLLLPAYEKIQNEQNIANCSEQSNIQA